MTCGFAFRNGGQPERIVAWLVVIAVGITTVLPRPHFATIVWPLLVADGVMLIGLVLVAAWADRFWPLYVAAVQLLAVTLHGVRAYDPTILPDVYARLGGLLAYPVLVILAIGTWRHRRRAPGFDWSWQVRRERALAGAAGG
ncbi:hypothetical protein [Sphingomonas bacterium]|uniref:hypothetical protein n=1 Tax=Sphingomonas bacterium TaxID=1895847 RepID=UPI0015770AA2|nr:hypothetical protein [Sphingomonas bacterium]